MAKKNREPVKPIEPESTEYETDTSSEEQEPLYTTVFKKPSTQPEQEQEDESEKEEESEQPKPTDPAITPSKRPAPSEPKKSAKKPKKKNAGTSSAKTPSTQRLFSDDDEIAILNGMIEFEAINNVSPTADMDAFLEFIKNSLHVDVSKRQLQDKIRKMRKRYAENKGKDMSSGKPREILDLSKILWGGGEKVEVKEVGNADGSVVKRKKTAIGGKKAAMVDMGDANVSGIRGNASKKTGNDGKKEAAVEVGSADGSVVTRRNVRRKTEDGGKHETAVKVGNDGGGVVRKNVRKKTEDAGKKEAAVEVGNANVSGVTRIVSKKKIGSGGKKEAAVKVVSNGAVGGSSYVGLSNEEKLLRMGGELFGGADKKITGWEEWKKLEREELELSVKQLDVKRGKMKLVLDTMK